jgi:Putative small multi-drug export protein.
VYEVIIYLITAVFLENAGGNLYGVAVGFDPVLVFFGTLIINLVVVVAVSLLIDRFLNWRKGAKDWISHHTVRGQRLVSKYAWLGIIAGTFVLSPMQTAIVGRMLMIEPRKFYPPLIVGTVLGCIVSMGVALGIFKIVLGW